MGNNLANAAATNGMAGNTKSILLVGVGGQGTILASKLLTVGLMEKGFDVKMSEIHGMSQRGGAVSSQVRYGGEVHSPVIELGGADILVSFEKMEALRWLEYLKKGGKAVVNDYEINPMPVIMGKRDYAPDILDEIRAVADTVAVAASEEAEKLGNGKIMNIILLGTIVKLTGLESMDWERIIRENVKQQFAEQNILALKKGISMI